MLLWYERVCCYGMRGCVNLVTTGIRPYVRIELSRPQISSILHHPLRRPYDLQREGEGVGVCGQFTGWGSYSEWHGASDGGLVIAR